MSEFEVDSARHHQARLTLSEGPKGPTLTAHVAPGISLDHFNRVTATAYELIEDLTRCPCMSGRIAFVIEEVYNQVINVNLGPARTFQGAGAGAVSGR